MHNRTRRLRNGLAPRKQIQLNCLIEGDARDIDTNCRASAIVAVWPFEPAKACLTAFEVITRVAADSTMARAQVCVDAEAVAGRLYTLTGAASALAALAAGTGLATLATVVVVRLGVHTAASAKKLCSGAHAVSRLASLPGGAGHAAIATVKGIVDRGHTGTRASRLTRTTGAIRADAGSTTATFDAGHSRLARVATRAAMGGRRTQVHTFCAAALSAGRASGHAASLFASKTRTAGRAALTAVRRIRAQMRTNSKALGPRAEDAGAL